MQVKKGILCAPNAISLKTCYTLCIQVLHKKEKVKLLIDSEICNHSSFALHKISTSLHDTTTLINVSSSKWAYACKYGPESFLFSPFVVTHKRKIGNIAYLVSCVFIRVLLKTQGSLKKLGEKWAFSFCFYLSRLSPFKLTTNEPSLK